MGDPRAGPFSLSNMVKSADNILVTKVEVVQVGPSPEDLALRLITVLEVQQGGPLNGTTQQDGSVTIENEFGEEVARVLPDGTAIIRTDGGEIGVCLTDLPQESAVAASSGDEMQSGLSEEDLWATLDDYMQDSCNPFEQSCWWDEGQQTQNNSKPFSSSESYASSAPKQQASTSTSTPTTNAVPQVEREDAPAASASDQAPKKPGDAAAALASPAAAAEGAAAPALEGDANLLAPAAMPPAPEAQPAPAVQPAASTIFAADADRASQEQARSQQAEESRPYPGVGALLDRVAGRVCRFVEAVIRGDEAAPRRDQGGHGAHAAGAAPRGASDADAKLQPLRTSDPMTGREGTHAADPGVAVNAVAKPTVRIPSPVDSTPDFPMGQVIQALIADVANDPLAMACATSAAGLFQLPPFTFVLGTGLSAFASIVEQRRHDYVQPMVTAQRGHGEERGQHDEQQQGRNQQQPDPYATELA